MGFGRKKKHILKKIIKITIFLFFIFGIGFGAYRYLEYEVGKIERNYLNKIENLKYEKYTLKRSVLIPKKDLKKGVILSEGDFFKKTIYSSIPQELFSSKIFKNNRLKIDLTKHEPLLKSMVAKEKIEDDIRIREISAVMLQSNLRQGDTVDFRIRYSNGMELTVLTKKIIEKIDLKNNTIWVRLSNDENLLLSSAIVDQATYIGTHFYLTKYVESNIQKKLRVNYTPNIKVSSLMTLKFDEKQLNDRKNLENDLVLIKEELQSKVEESVALEKATVENRVERIKEKDKKLNKDSEEEGNDFD